MTAKQMRALLEDVPDEATVHFSLGDHATPLVAREWYNTTTKDTAYIEFEVPDGWLRT